MNRKPLVSIIIPHHNGEALLRRCLQSIVNDPYEPREIIIVDNASSDSSIDAAAREFAGLRVLHPGKNLGYAGGCNFGMQQAKGDYFLLFNNDAVATPGWLPKLVAFAEAQADVAAVQPKIKSLSNKSSFDYAGAAGGEIDIFGYPFARGRIFFTIEEDRGQYDAPVDIFWASGACVLVRRAAIETTGMLDESFFAHMEEIDLSWRFWLAGYRVAYFPEVVIYHEAGSTLAQGSPRKVYFNHRNSLLMLLKNYTGKNLLWIMPVRLLLEGVACLFHLAMLRVASAAAIVRAWLALPKFAKSIRTQRKAIRAFRRHSDRDVMRRMFRNSIVIQYFLFGRKTYRSLPLD